MTEELMSIWDFVITNPWALLILKVALIIVVGATVQVAIVLLYAQLTRELARWLWGYLGICLMAGAPIVAVLSGGWWWLAPPFVILIIALYTRVEYRDKGVPTTWVEVSGSLKWKSLGYDEVKGPPEVAAVAEYLIHDAALESGVQALAEGRLKEARQEFETIAAAGNVAAMNNLGVIYEAGLGVTPSKEEALMWYRQAASDEAPVAQVNLAVLLAADHLRDPPPPQSDRKRDFIEAYGLLSSADAQGLKLAKRGLRDLRKKMTREEIDAAKTARNLRRSGPPV